MRRPLDFRRADHSQGRFLRASASFLAISIALASGMPAAAEDADTDGGYYLEDGTYVLGTIYITSTKRSEDAQDVPIPITVLGKEELQFVLPTASNAEIARSVPNFSYLDNSAQYGNVGVIRGVGSFAALSPEDTSVVYNLDEIPRSAYSMPITMMDIDQVEVLRGPQGTLFGRNSQGGAVNFTSNAPTFDREFRLKGEVGSNGYYLGELVANTPLIDDTLAARLALQYTSKDGDVPNVVTGGDEGGVKLGAARASLLFTPSADTTAQLTFNYAKSDDHAARFVLLDADDYPVSATNPENEFDRENYSLNLRVEHDFDSFRFTSISSVERDKLSETLDITDGLAFAALTGYPQSYFDVDGTDLVAYDKTDTTYFQEFRLSSYEGDPISWVAGVNFFRSDLSGQSHGDTFSIPSYALFSGDQDNDLSTTSTSAFGEITAPIVGGLKATAGLRLTHEKKEATYRFTGNGATGTVDSHTQYLTFEDTFLTGRAGLSYDWSDDLMTYASVSRGAVAGGMPWMSTVAAYGSDAPTYPTSTSWTYEAGFKSMLLDGRMMLNGSLFFNDVKNGHLLVVDSSTLALSTAALDYESYGAELEARFELTEDIKLFGGVGYTHAELKNVPASSPSGAEDGNAVPNVPLWTANIGAEYRTDASVIGLRTGEIFASGQYQFVGSRQADVGNNFELASYGITNLRLGWQGDRSSFYVFANNLFDVRYEAVGTYLGSGVETVRPGAGRVVGIGFTKEF